MWGNTLMNSLFYVSSAGAGAVFSKTSHFITRSSSSLLGFSSYVSSSSWKSRINHHPGIKATNLDVMLTRFHVQTYSSSARSLSSSKSKKKLLAPATSSFPMEEDNKNTFYIVRKGDIVAVYKSLSDCQAQVGNSVCDPSVSVFKGHSLPKETEAYLTARGLKNPLYSINAADVNEDLFGDLVPCPFQEPLSKDKTADKVSPPKRSLEVLGSSSNTALTSLLKDPSRKQIKLDSSVKEQITSSKCISCTLQFDGASKGNPGLAGAGAVLRSDDGRLVYRLREGVGIATNNVAEYRAMLLGLKQALKKGFKRISVRGDSKLVCMQVQGLWKAKNENMAILCKEAKELKDKFHSFDIGHVLREFNSEADAQANFACNLMDGDVEVECEQA